ncbi:glycosyltransferase family 2 protein [Aureimonas leprariae]|nr:glycosyltransferase family 2 protein [Aureimonas leprariae]
MSPAAAETPVYSIVIPLFNEEAALPILLHRLEMLLERLDGPAEVILVDDGSRDTTGIVAAGRARTDPRFRCIRLSRNFGHQVAITAGMDAARGSATVVMDADLQDPPEVVLELARKWREGYEVVYAQRSGREGENWLKKGTAALFYRTLARVAEIDIPMDVGDFRLVDRKALDAFRAMPERDRFVRGMFGWMGFRQAVVPFRRMPRAAGVTKYPWRRMLRLASDGIVGFSDAPLRAVLWLGFAISAAAFGFGLFAIGAALAGSVVPGWASLAVLLSFLSGVNLTMTGVVGLYVGRIHNEVKQRPLYVVSEAVGTDSAAAAMPAERARAVR